MKRILIILLLILIPALCFSQDDSSLEFSVYTKPQYIIGREVPVMVKLANRGKKIFQINRRFFLNERKSYYELRFEVKDPHGNLLPFEAKPQFILPGSEDYIILKQGKSVSFRLDLDNFYIFIEPGEYRIKAFYKNYLSPPPGAAWIGTIESYEKIFSVTEPEVKGEKK